jgi:hypothetical protein
MSDVNITLPDGSRRSVPAGTPVLDIATGISPRLAKASLAAVVDGRLVDLTYPLNADASVRLVTADSPEALPLYRHSTAHLLAAAVTNLFRASSVESGRRLTKASSTTSWCRGRSSRGPRADREEDARARAAGSAVRAADVAA